MKKKKMMDKLLGQKVLFLVVLMLGFKIVKSQESAIAQSFEKNPFLTSSNGKEDSSLNNGSVKTNELESVVVVGYGTQRKSAITGSVGTVNSSALTDRNFTSPVEAIQGNVAGVQISNGTGRVGEGFNITVRGKNTFGGDASPLYVVDGSPVDNIDFLSPNDIERVDVLKDAASTAIYGSRGSRGVILVTTKSGTTSKEDFNISVETFYGSKQVTRLPDFMSGDQWWKFNQVAYLKTSLTSTITDYTQIDATTLSKNQLGNAANPQINSLLLARYNNKSYFNWVDAIVKNGLQSNTHINLNGKSGGLGYNFGLGYQRETGNIDKEELNKFTAKLGLNHRANKYLTLGLNVTLTYADLQRGSDVAMREAFRLSPLLTPYTVNKDDSLQRGADLATLPGKLASLNNTTVNILDRTSNVNPLLQIQRSSDQSKRWDGLANFFAQLKPLSWLSLKSSLTTGFFSESRQRSWGKDIVNSFLSNSALQTLPSGRIETSNLLTYTWDNQFDIDYTYKEDHNFKLLGLQSAFFKQNETSLVSAINLPFDVGAYNIGSGANTAGNLTIGSNYIKQTLLSYALRLNYDYKNKYFVMLSSRWDGTSVFTASNRWGNFLSSSIGWKIDEESFMKSTKKYLSNLKLRASYGVSGNNAVNPYSTISTANQTTYANLGNGSIPATLSNPNLQWEKTTELNFGLDFGFFNNRISGTVDYYDRLSSDLLIKQAITPEVGFASSYANVGSVNNRGIELSLSTINVETKLISWTTMFTFTSNKNEVRSIYGGSKQDVGNNLFVGQSVDVKYNYQYDGVWQKSEAAEAAKNGQLEGQAKVKDVNGDGKITTDDRTFLGNENPTWSGSVFSKLQIADFDFSFSIITNQGVFVYSPFHEGFLDYETDRNRQKLNINYYIPENGAGIASNFTNAYPMPKNTGTYWTDSKVGYYRDASFVKVKSITLGYSLPQNLLKKAHIKRCRIYANVLNPFVFTKYDGFDPEWASSSWEKGGVSTITYQAGLSLSF